jgi:hypothetical protein
MFYSEILALTIGAYMEFFISGWLNIIEPITTTNGETVAFCVGIYSLVMTVIVMPAVFYYILKQPLSRINQDSFIQKWEGAFDGVKTSSKAQLAFYPVFAARRVIFVLTVFWLPEHPTFQILSCLLTNLAVMIYKGQFKPLVSRFRNRLELFNELSIVLVHIHIMFFTDWVPDSEQRSNFGYSMICVMAFNLGVNMVIILYYATRQIYFILRKKYLKC